MSDIASWIGGVLIFALTILFVVVTGIVWDRWGILAGLAFVAGWLLMELTVWKAVHRRRSSDGGSVLWTKRA